MGCPRVMAHRHVITIAAALVCLAASGCDTEGKKLRPDQERSRVAAYGAAHHAADAPAAAMGDEGKAPADGKAAPDAPADAPANAPADAPAGSDPMCEAAAKNLVKLMKPEMEKQLAQVPEAQRAMVEQQMKTRLTVPVLTQQCEAQKPSPEELTCVVNAKTVEELQGCQGRPGGPPPPRPAPGGAAPGGAAPDGAAPVAPPKPAGPAPGGAPPAPAGDAKAPAPKPPTPKPPADGKADG